MRLLALLLALPLLVACGGGAYALSPDMDRPDARWVEGVLAARTKGSTDLLPYTCDEAEMFVRELHVDARRGRFEVYGCGRTAVYVCDRRTTECERERR
ncbi:MAG: hypothetical protein RLP09_09625 [Sandaracinaceae bacterium]